MAPSRLAKKRVVSDPESEDDVSMSEPDALAVDEGDYEMKTKGPADRTSFSTSASTPISTLAHVGREKLKIRIKLGSRPGTGRATTTPTAPRAESVAGSTSRPWANVVSEDSDQMEGISGEDELLPDDASEVVDDEAAAEDSDAEEEESADEVYPKPSARLTARQAVLASGTSEHVELGVLPSRRSRKDLSFDIPNSLSIEEKTIKLEEALAVKKEEAARKREEMALKRKLKGIKKLEDDKEETINRLLKKQSRGQRSGRGGRGGRGGSATKEGSLAGSGDENGTPIPIGALPFASGHGSTPVPTAGLEPQRLRWISTSRVPFDSGMTLDGVPNTPLNHSLSLSIPSSFPLATSSAPPRSTPPCAVASCPNPRKYRLVGAPDWETGACGITCLNVLKAGLASG